jgi:hypothetical protein
MKHASEIPCPFCENGRLVPNELLDGTVIFFCSSSDCMAVIKFAPIAFGQPVPAEEAFARINKRNREV